MSSTSTPQPAPTSGATRFFHRYPRLTILGVLFGVCLAVALAFEIGLRLFGTLNIHYYTGTRTPGLHRFPYGEVPINSFGYPDEEFNLAGNKRRIGYLGDSVAFGVGAGYGYRIPDLMQQRFPEYEHWVFANVGMRLEEKVLLRQIDEFKLNSVIYLMNLNDIIPDENSAESSTWITTTRAGWMDRIDEGLRGTSYLYTYVRLGLKNALQRFGYEVHGMPAFELAPTAHSAVVEATAARVAHALSAATAGTDRRACVLILPYEMQVSADAAKVYRQMGFSWEPGFEDGSTQKLLMKAFERLGVTAFDGRDAFAGTDLKVGDAFVYNKGDKVDWNHPTRRGHEVLSAWLAARPGLTDRCLGPVH